MATRMQQRRGTAAQWISTNDGNGPILAIGEIGYESDTNKFKIGDGVNHWVDLSYFVDLETTIAGAPGLLNSLDELAAAIGDDPSFFTTVGTNLANHEADTTNIHGIADTAELATKDYVTTQIGNSTVDQSALAGDGISWNAGTEQFDVDNTVVRSADLTELAQDAVNTAIVAGTGLDKSYNDTANTITIDIDSTVVTKTGTQTLTNKTLTSPTINTPTGITKSDVGLNNVDNSSDAAKPVSTATQIALDLKAPLASPTFTGTVSGITKSMVGLGNVDNTSDANKQISDATQTALNLKAPIASPTFTGNVSGITKGMVGLGNVNNTSDADKPISDAAANALSLLAPLNSPRLTGTAVAANLTVNNDLVVTGDLTVSGTTTTVNTTNFTTADPLIYLGNGNNANLVDLGIVGSYNDGTYAHQGLVKDASSGKWKLFKGVTDEPTTTINFAQASYDDLAVGALEASSLIVGDITNTEFGYLNGVTSAIQGQLDTKLSSSTASVTYAPIVSPTFTGTVSGITKSMVGLGSVDNTTDANKPVSTATQTALDLKAPLASPTFTGTVSGVTKSHVGLGNVDNTSDANKPISTATQTALDLKANSADITELSQDAVNTALTAGTGITKTYNDAANTITVAVDTTAIQARVANVSDTEIGYLDGVTGAIQSQIDLKAPLANPVFTGTVNGITKSMVGLGNVDNTTDATKPISTATQAALELKAPLASPTFTGTVSGVTKSMVGLGSVDNTADSAKPVSTAQQAALDLKAPLASPTFTGTVSGITKSMVGLSAVENTSDANKPISTATSNALDLKAPLASPALTGVPTAPTAAAATNTTQVATTAFVRGEVTALVNGASAALDTLGELAAALTADEATAATLATLVGTKAPIASPTFTGTVSGITKSMVGLGNVDNTTDALKPISTATQTALDLKLASATAASTYAPLASPALTGSPTAPTAAAADNSTKIATTAYADRAASNAASALVASAPAALDTLNELAAALGNDASFSTTVTNSIATKAPLASPTFTGTVSGITKSMVGLANVDNTADTAKPISTATQTALDLKLASATAATTYETISNVALKAPLASPTFTGTVTIPAGASISGFATLASPALTGVPTAPTAAVATNTTQIATTAYVRGEVAALVAAAPAALDTLNELAAALGNDASFATTVSTNLGLKAPLASPTFTGTVTIPSGAALGTPASGVLTNATGLPVATGISGLGTGTATFLATPSSANFAAMITDEIGTGNIQLSDIATSAQTASYTLALADKAKLVEMNVASANTLTVPTNASVAFPVGSKIDILQVGAGQTTITPADGTVTINGTPGLKLRAQWSSVTLIKRATNTWVVVGDLTA